MAVGMSEVEVRIEYGKYSNEEADKFYCYLKETIQSFVPHAEVTCVKESLDLGKTNLLSWGSYIFYSIGASNLFNVYINNKEICLRVSKGKMNIPKVSLACCKFFPSSHTKNHTLRLANVSLNTIRVFGCLWLLGAKLCIMLCWLKWWDTEQ